MASPFLWIFASAFDNGPGKYVPWPSEPTFDNFRDLWNDDSIRTRIAQQSFHFDDRHGAGHACWRRWLDSRSPGCGSGYKTNAVYAVLLLYAIPIAATMVAIYDLADRLDLIDTYRGLILAQTAIVLPFLIWLNKGFYDGLPRYLDEAAAIDGRSTWRAWLEILLPLSKTGLAITAGFAFTAAWSEVLLVLDPDLPGRQDDARLSVLQLGPEASATPQVTAALGVLYLAAGGDSLPDPASLDGAQPDYIHPRALMARVDLIHLWKTYSEKAGPIVRNLSLTIEDGELISLLGPSGCGKTTTLRMIAGLEFPDAGEIIIGDQNVVPLPAKDRDIALVFQQYALYPHMTVRENLEYPLKIQKLSARRKSPNGSTMRRSCSNLTNKMDRKPGELSGGEQQRVALGRAIVRRPKVFLMDEPLSNLDAILRVQMRSHLKALQRETGVTTIVVTHDQSEAMSMSDRIAVMNQGIIQQIGEPDHIYQHPANTFVAGFIGDPPMNLMAGERTADGIVVDENWVIPAPADLPQGPVTVGARPETIRLSLSEKEGWHPMSVYISEPQGSDTIVNLRLGRGIHPGRDRAGDPARSERNRLGECRAGRAAVLRRNHRPGDLGLLL